MITRIGSTIGSSVEGAIPSVAVALNRPTSSFVMYALSAQGRGGMSSTAIRCWRFAVRSITAPLTGYLNVINSVCKKRKNHRMLLVQYDSSERALEWVEATLMPLYLGNVGWVL